MTFVPDIPQPIRRSSTPTRKLLMLLEDLRAMLLDWAIDNEENPEKYSDLGIDGPPFECKVEVAPRNKRDRSGPVLVICAQKDINKGWSFTIRVVAKSANMTYDIRLKEKGKYPQLEVRQFETRAANGMSGNKEFKNCIPALVIDLIEARLPPAILDHHVGFFFPSEGLNKPCMGCGTSTYWKSIVCPECSKTSRVTAE